MFPAPPPHSALKSPFAADQGAAVVPIFALMNGAINVFDGTFPLQQEGVSLAADLVVL